MINLDKGGRIDLTKGHAELKKIRVGLGWDENGSDTGYDFDLDASAFVLKTGADGKPHLVSEQHFVFYNNLACPQNAVVHSGDNLTGDADGDDEVITVDVDALNANTVIEEVSFVVTIHDAEARRQNFGQVGNAYIAVYNDETDEMIAKYQLDEDFSVETAVQFGSIYKADGEWKFKAIGAGYQVGLAAFIEEYGCEAA